MKRFAVIGLGKFGFQVARKLYEEGHEVVALDESKIRVDAIAPYCTEAVLLNATDKERLASLGLEEMDCVIISTGTHIATSILLSLHLQEFGVKRIMVKAIDEDHEKILLRVGATDIVQPEREMASKVARSLSTPNILDFIPLEKEYNLVQIEAPKSFVGKTLKDLGLPSRYEVYVIGIKTTHPDTFTLVPSADTVIDHGHHLVLIGHSAQIKKIEKMSS